MFFLTYFTLYNRLQFHPPHQNWFKCVLFNSWIIFHCVYVPQLSYPLICQWTSRLLSCPSYYKSAAMNIGVHESLSVLVSSVRMPSSGIAGSYGTLLGRKVMTNLDSILKSRDIALPKKFRLVKAIVSSSHVWVWELDYKESWALNNCCFWTVVLEKTLESPSDCKEIQPVHPKRDKSWGFIGRSDVEAAISILWPPDAKSWLIWKDPDAGKYWRQEEKGTSEDKMVGWHHQLSGHEFG